MGLGVDTSKGSAEVTVTLRETGPNLTCNLFILIVGN